MFDKLNSPAAAHAELFHVFGFCFFRFGVGVSILEFFCCKYEMCASFGAIRFADRIRSFPVKRWYEDRSRPRIDSGNAFSCMNRCKKKLQKKLQLSTQVCWSRLEAYQVLVPQNVVIEREPHFQSWTQSNLRLIRCRLWIGCGASWRGWNIARFVDTSDIVGKFDLFFGDSDGAVDFVLYTGKAIVSIASRFYCPFQWFDDRWAYFYQCAFDAAFFYRFRRPFGAVCRIVTIWNTSFLHFLLPI